jgi:hypothetical protein
MCAKARDPNTLKLLKFTLSPPLQACSGVVSDNALVDDLFLKYTAVFTASAQYFLFSPDYQH